MALVALILSCVALGAVIAVWIWLWTVCCDDLDENR